MKRMKGLWWGFAISLMCLVHLVSSQVCDREIVSLITEQNGTCPSVGLNLITTNLPISSLVASLIPTQLPSILLLPSYIDISTILQVPSLVQVPSVITIPGVTQIPVASLLPTALPLPKSIQISVPVNVPSTIYSLVPTKINFPIISLLFSLINTLVPIPIGTTLVPSLALSNVISMVLQPTSVITFPLQLSNILVPVNSLIQVQSLIAIPTLTISLIQIPSIQLIPSVVLSLVPSVIDVVQTEILVPIDCALKSIKSCGNNFKPCYIDMTATCPCPVKVIQCPTSADCEVHCGTACKNTQIICPGNNKNCRVFCDGGSGACSNTTVLCNGGNCQVFCSPSSNYYDSICSELTLTYGLITPITPTSSYLYCGGFGSNTCNSAVVSGPLTNLATTNVSVYCNGGEYSAVNICKDMKTFCNAATNCQSSCDSIVPGACDELQVNCGVSNCGLTCPHNRCGNLNCLLPKSVCYNPNEIEVVGALCPAPTDCTDACKMPPSTTPSPSFTPSSTLTPSASVTISVTGSGTNSISISSTITNSVSTSSTISSTISDSVSVGYSYSSSIELETPSQFITQGTHTKTGTPSLYSSASRSVKASGALKSTTPVVTVATPVPYMTPSASRSAFAKHIPCEGVDCNDNNPCTQDICTNNGCVHLPIACDDGMECMDSFITSLGNPCTIDTCSVTSGCIFTPTNNEECAIAVKSCSDHLDCESCNSLSECAWVHCGSQLDIVANSTSFLLSNSSTTTLVFYSTANMSLVLEGIDSVDFVFGGFSATFLNSSDLELLSLQASTLGQRCSPVDFQDSNCEVLPDCSIRSYNFLQTKSVQIAASAGAAGALGLGFGGFVAVGALFYRRKKRKATIDPTFQNFNETNDNQLHEKDDFVNAIFDSPSVLDNSTHAV